MFPHIRLLFQPTPTPTLCMLPARPMDTALPPPMLYSTSSPMTLPEPPKLDAKAREETLQRAALKTSQQQAEGSWGADVRVMFRLRVELRINEGRCCRGRFVLPVCSRCKGAIGTKRIPHRWLEGEAPMLGTRCRSCWGEA